MRVVVEVRPYMLYNFAFDVELTFATQIRGRIALKFLGTDWDAIFLQLLRPDQIPENLGVVKCPKRI